MGRTNVESLNLPVSLRKDREEAAKEETHLIVWISNAKEICSIRVDLGLREASLVR